MHYYEYEWYNQLFNDIHVSTYYLFIREEIVEPISFEAFLNFFFTR